MEFKARRSVESGKDEERDVSGELKFEKCKSMSLKIREKLRREVRIPELTQNTLQKAKKKVLLQPMNHSEIVERQRKNSEMVNLKNNSRLVEGSELESRIDFGNFGFSSWAQDLDDKEKMLEEEKKKNEMKRVLEKEKFEGLTEYLYMSDNKSLKKIDLEKVNEDVNSAYGFESFDRMKFKIENLKKDERKAKVIRKSMSELKNVKMRNIDFLAEVRKLRDEKEILRGIKGLDWKNELSEGSFFGDIWKVKNKKIQIFEYKGHTHENLLNNFNNYSKGMLKKSKILKKMINSSIKTKLAAVEKIV